MHNKPHTEEAKLKMSIAAKKRCTPEWGKKSSEMSLKLWKDPIYRKRQSEAHKGQHSSPETEFKKGEAPWNKGKKSNRGEELHHNWKGDDVGYISLHQWVARHKEKPKKCEFCESNRNLQWSNISGEYKRDLNDWQCLCAKCHYKFDRGGKKKC